MLGSRMADSRSMAQLTGELEASFPTDFGILSVHQYPEDASSDTCTFATSRPGAVSAFCGSEFPQVRARLELWDGRPPGPPPEWEDCDGVALPCRWRSGRIGGSDPPDGDGLDVERFADARMQELARGRHQYTDGTSRPNLSTTCALGLAACAVGASSARVESRRLVDRAWRDTGVPYDAIAPDSMFTVVSRPYLVHG